MEACFLVRHEVFVVEQGIDPHLDRNGSDGECSHWLLRAAGQAVGTGRLRPVNGRVKLERIAVLAAFRGLGCGRVLVQEMLKGIPGSTGLTLNAQQKAVGFWLAMGFTTQGPPHWEAGIAHQKMGRETRPCTKKG